MISQRSDSWPDCPTPTRKTAGLLGLAIAFWLAHAAPASAADAPGGTDVVMKDFMFVPMSLTVKVGSTVTWTNHDGEPHTVISDSGLFRSAALDTNDRFSFRFEQPGTYHFVCSIHPRMLGTIIVK